MGVSKSLKDYTAKDKRQIIGLLTEIMVRSTFDNHFYKWKGEILRQTSGGAIGLRATGTCSKIVMDKWMELFSELLVNNGIEVYLLKKYVDDVLLVCSNVILGSYWSSDDKKIIFCPELQKQHISLGKSRTEVSLEIFIQMADNFFSFLKFTGEASVDKPIACLDSQLWVGEPSADGKWYNSPFSPGLEPANSVNGVGFTVLYKFYKKPMATKQGILFRSAMPEQIKICTAVEEIKRRWKNTSEYVSSRTYFEITTDYMDELGGSGYNGNFRWNVLNSAIVGYERVLDLARKNLTFRNREGYTTKMSRRVKKLCGKSDWFKNPKKSPDDVTHNISTKTNQTKKKHISKPKRTQPNNLDGFQQQGGEHPGGGGRGMTILENDKNKPFF